MPEILTIETCALITTLAGHHTRVEATARDGRQFVVSAASKPAAVELLAGVLALANQADATAAAARAQALAEHAAAAAPAAEG